MDKQMSDSIRHIIAKVVGLLVRQDYAGIESLSKGIRLKANHIEAGVIDYGRTLIDPPEIAFEDIDVIHVDASSPSQYSIRFRLYTEEEGKSDLELQATVFDSGDEKDVRIEIDGILVA